MGSVKLCMGFQGLLELPSKIHNLIVFKTFPTNKPHRTSSIKSTKNSFNLVKEIVLRKKKT